MTPQQLIAEGRALQRECVFLRPDRRGEVAALWYEFDRAEVDETGCRCWLTVDARFLPKTLGAFHGYLTLITDEESCTGGRIELAESWPERIGRPLYPHPAQVLPPIDAVFAKGSEAVGTWLKSKGWDRDERYNPNFGCPDIVNPYEQIYFDEYPLYSKSSIFAMLGGWHWPGADDDWHSLIDERLLFETFEDSEPWVETWYLSNGDFKVIQRTS